MIPNSPQQSNIFLSAGETILATPPLRLVAPHPFSQGTRPLQKGETCPLTLNWHRPMFSRISSPLPPTSPPQARSRPPMIRMATINVTRCQVSRSGQHTNVVKLQFNKIYPPDYAYRSPNPPGERRPSTPVSIAPASTDDTRFD